MHCSVHSPRNLRLTKFTEFTSDQIVKAALMIGQNEKRMNLFFTTPDEFKPEFVQQVLEKSKKKL